MYPVLKLQAGMKSPGTSFNVRSFLDEGENPNQKELRSCHRKGATSETAHEILILEDHPVIYTASGNEETTYVVQCMGFFEEKRKGKTQRTGHQVCTRR